MLRRGITTGTCAAAAARAAAQLLLLGRAPDDVSIVTPCGEVVNVAVEERKTDGTSAVCAVRKYAGDDPDVTDGLLIYAKVTRTDGEFCVDGGEGVGRVTKRGLKVPPGNAAINPVPREMILSQLRGAAEIYGGAAGLRAVISVPGGRAAAKKTFNPRLGIEDGISILGTSGIVEPMSEKAVTDTIETELRYRRENGYRYAILSPGNYGRAFASERFGLDIDAAVKCSNFIGDSLDIAVRTGFEGVFLIGHAGKLVKLASGIMNTHSRIADGRMETVTAAAALCGAGIGTLGDILDCVTTEEAWRVLSDNGFLHGVSKILSERAEYYIGKRCSVPFAFSAFSEGFGEIMHGGDIKIMKEAVYESLYHRDGDR